MWMAMTIAILISKFCVHNDLALEMYVLVLYGMHDACYCMAMSKKTDEMHVALKISKII